ncbi:hypothetical protein ACP4OV_003262 [Aristida adscensionis]
MIICSRSRHQLSINPVGFSDEYAASPLSRSISQASSLYALSTRCNASWRYPVQARRAAMHQVSKIQRFCLADRGGHVTRRPYIERSVQPLGRGTRNVRELRAYPEFCDDQAVGKVTKMMAQLSPRVLAAVLLLVACVAAGLGAASAQYGGGNSGAAGTGPVDGAGYLLGAAAGALAVAAFVWT